MGLMLAASQISCGIENFNAAWHYLIVKVMLMPLIVAISKIVMLQHIHIEIIL